MLVSSVSSLKNLKVAKRLIDDYRGSSKVQIHQSFSRIIQLLMTETEPNCYTLASTSSLIKWKASLILPLAFAPPSSSSRRWTVGFVCTERWSRGCSIFAMSMEVVCDPCSRQFGAILRTLQWQSTNGTTADVSAGRFYRDPFVHTE